MLRSFRFLAILLTFLLSAGIASADPVRLVFAQPPTWAMPGQAFPAVLKVRAENADGTVDSSFSGSVNIAIKPGTGTENAVLSGTATVSALYGIAYFPGLFIDLAGRGYVLTATADTLTCESRPFAVGSGNVATWGSDKYGQTGTAMPPAQTPVPGIMTGCTAISAGVYHTVALKGDGTVWSWGQNPYGQLGDGTNSSSTVPVKAKGLSGVIAISASSGSEQGHSLALRADGTVWAWGSNSSCQLGNGTIQSSNVPARVLGLANIVSISAGERHSLAVDGDGTVWVWGDNTYGQLGDGANSNHYTACPLSGVSGIVSVSTGRQHTLAVKNDGTVWAWGVNTYGQLGDGTTIDRQTPVHVAGLTDVIAVSAGLEFSMALRRDGTVWAWGYNVQYQMGDGTQTPRATAAPILGLSGIVAISACNYSCLAVDRSGLLWAWGGDYESSKPKSIAGFTGAVSASANYTRSHAVTQDGRVWSWGERTAGIYGDGSTSISLAPVSVAPNLGGAVAVGAGLYHSVALLSDGTVRTWGLNGLGQMGDGTTTDRFSPVTVSGLSGVVSISAGDNHCISLKNDGTVWGWGFNGSGSTGDGTTGAIRSTPVRATGITGVSEVSGGGFHSLALKTAGTAWAFGDNTYGQLGDGTNISRKSAVVVSGLTGVVSISAGRHHSLALKSDGTVWAWGRNQYGSLGDGTTTDRNRPVQVSGLSGIVAIAAGRYHNVALRNDGTVWGWGYNNWFQVAGGPSSVCTTPVQHPYLSDIIAISAADDHSLAVRSDNALLCWGLNSDGQLGIGSKEAFSQPTPATGLTGVIAFGGGGWHSIAVSAAPIAASLAFRTQPTAAAAGLLTTQPVIEMRGTDGQPMTGFTAPVTIYVKPGAGPKGAYMSGKTVAKFVDGVAAFSNLGISQRGQGYVLQAVVEGLPPADSQPFTVSGGTMGWADVLRILRLAGGLGAAAEWDIANGDVESPAGGVDLLDAQRIARKAAGLDTNP